AALSDFEPHVRRRVVRFGRCLGPRSRQWHFRHGATLGEAKGVSGERGGPARVVAPFPWLAWWSGAHRARRPGADWTRFGGFWEVRFAALDFGEPGASAPGGTGRLRGLTPPA